MKKVLLAILITLFWVSSAYSGPWDGWSSGGIETASNCNVAAYFPLGTLCQDTDDGKLYKGTGAAVVEIAAGSSGDVVAAADTQTWGSGTEASLVWTYSVTGITPTLTATAGQLAVGGTLALGANNITSTGSLGATGAGKLTKGWFTDLEITNLPSINGTAIHTSPTFTTSILPQASTATIGSTSAEWGGLYLGDSKIIYGQADQSNTLTSSSTGWTAALNLSAASFIPTAAANAAGEIGFASHAFSLFANSEDLTFTASADKWTIASGTSATLTLTPATTVTGQLTMSANPRIYDGDSHYLTLDAADLTGNATVAIGGDTNTLTVANGTASLTLTADQAVKFGTLTATKYCTWETATGITCTSEGGEAGSGDVTDIGDCSSGACLDGSSDGGTYISFYDAQGATKLQVGDNSGAVTLTLPTTTGTLMLTDAEITALAGLTSAANAIPYFTGSGTAGVISSSANMVSLLGSTDYATARTNLGLAIGTNVQAYDAELAALAGLTSAQGSIPYFTGSGTATTLAKGTAAQMLQMNSGATAPEWTSTLSITGIDLTSGTFNIPNGTTALNTGAGRIYFNTTSKAFSIGDGSSSYYAPTSLAPLSFTTGGTTARTVTLPNADATLLYSGGALGTPSGGTLTNATGLPVSTGVAGLGTNVATALAVNIGSAGAPVLFNGAGGTPTSLNLSNAVMNSGTTLPETCTVGQIFQDTDADTNGTVYFCRATDTWKDIDDDGGEGGMATTDMDTSAEVLGIVTDETGSASGTPLLVFNQAPRIDNIELGAATDTTIARSAAGVVTIEGATILTNTVPAVVDGHAAANLTAASMSDPRCTVTNYGQSAEDVAVTLPTAAANLSCLFTVGTAQSGNKWGVRAGTNDKIYLIAAAGTIGAGNDNGYARMTAAQVGQSFACWSFTTGSGAYDWQCKAISIGSSTFAAN